MKTDLLLIVFALAALWCWLKFSVSERTKRRRGDKKRLYEMQDGRCNGCGKSFHRNALTFDHILARKQGGTSKTENLQLLCRSCNSIKGDRPMSYLLNKVKNKKVGMDNAK